MPKDRSIKLELVVRLAGAEPTPKAKKKSKKAKAKTSKKAKPPNKEDGEALKNTNVSLEDVPEDATADGLDFFFGNRDNFILACEGDFEGHYPGNQNNVVLIPRGKGVTHERK